MSGRLPSFGADRQPDVFPLELSLLPSGWRITPLEGEQPDVLKNAASSNMYGVWLALGIFLLQII